MADKETRKTTKTAKPPSEARLRAWREARVQSYLKRSPDSLARMLVELEDDQGCIPEFEIDEEWPTNG